MHASADEATLLHVSFFCVPALAMEKVEAIQSAHKKTCRLPT